METLNKPAYLFISILISMPLPSSYSAIKKNLSKLKKYEFQVSFTQILFIPNVKNVKNSGPS